MRNMTPILNIITACIRPQNLETIWKSIIDANKHERFAVKWHICYDWGKKPAFNNPERVNGVEIIQSGVDGHSWGYEQRNLLISTVPVGWICFLDDDTVMRSTFIDVLHKEIATNPDKKAFIFSMHKGDGTPEGIPYCEAKPENVKVDYVGGEQYVLDREFIEGKRFRIDRYNADGFFIVELYQKNPEAFQFVNDFVWHNYLRPE